MVVSGSKKGGFEYRDVTTNADLAFWQFRNCGTTIKLCFEYLLLPNWNTSAWVQTKHSGLSPSFKMFVLFK